MLYVISAAWRQHNFVVFNHSSDLTAQTTASTKVELLVLVLVLVLVLGFRAFRSDFQFRGSYFFSRHTMLYVVSELGRTARDFRETKSDTEGEMSGFGRFYCR